MAAMFDFSSREASALTLLRCQEALEKGETNVVAEVLKGQGTFYEMNHYPEGDVFDTSSGSQYYYHAHRGPEQEHGHFHLFLRASAFDKDIAPARGEEVSEPWPEGDEALMHLVGISMDAYGLPQGLFVTNRWVTDETWFSAEDVIRHLDRFAVTHATPNWAVNIWLTAFVRLFREEIIALIRERDRQIAAARKSAPGADVLEDRHLEILAWQPVDLAATLAPFVRK